MLPTSRQPFPRLARLRAFDSVAAAGAMGTAADLLHVTQPAISRAVAALERELGVRLLARRRGGSFLTEEGRVFARRTRRFFLNMNAALGETVGAQGEAVARLARRISTAHLRGLLAIAAAGSFRRAAQAQGIAEPTLHRAARDLERMVKTSLFRRTPDGIGLSPAGAELARRFSLCTVEIAAGMEELATRRGIAQTTMTLGVLPLAPKRIAAMAAETILRAHPDSRLLIREGDYDELIGALRGGAIDLIFGSLRSPAPFPDLDEESLFEDPYRVVCRRDHPLTRLPRPRIADLREYDWVFATANFPRRAVLDRMIADGRLSARVQIETNSVGALVAILSNSDRISLLPRQYIGFNHHSSLLAVLDMAFAHPVRRVGLTTRADWLPTAFQSEFLALMRAISSDSVSAGKAPPAAGPDAPRRAGIKRLVKPSK
jgi:LysR family transcriptional regulator of gallate degradation